MTMTLHKTRRPDAGRVTLTLLPSTFRAFHTAWLERGSRVACHGQIGNDLVPVVVQGTQLFLQRGQRRMQISGLSLPELQRLLEAPSTSAYTSVPVVLTPCEDTSPAARRLREPEPEPEPEAAPAPDQPAAAAAAAGAAAAAAPAEEGGQRFINRTAVTVKPRRLVVVPPREDAQAPASAPAKDRPTLVFRRPAEPASR
jgi:hypothetical protein